MEKDFDFTLTDEILDKYEGKEKDTIAILQEIQAVYRYLPREIFARVAKKVGVSEAKVYGVATFYENFSLEPKGKYVIKVCDGTACHVRKSPPILERFRKELGLLETKHTTDDMLFTVETVSCLGACGLAPAITLNGEVYANMTPDKASELVKKIKEDAKNA